MEWYLQVKNVRLAKTQLRQFSGVNMEENLESFDYWADKFSKLPLYYLTFHGASEVSEHDFRTKYELRNSVSFRCPYTGKSIGFERHKTVPEKWLVLRVGFDPSSYTLGGENLFEWAI